MNETLFPHEVTEFLESGKAQIASDLTSIGCTVSNENLEQLFEADLQTRQTVWSGIFKQLNWSGSANSFDEYLREVKFSNDYCPDRVESIKRIHSFLNFDDKQFLKDLGIDEDE